MIDFDLYAKAEYLQPTEIKKLQKDLFKKYFIHLASSPYYKNILREQGIKPDKFEIEDLAALPFTAKADFEKHNNQFLAVSLSQISDIVCSSGTTGIPTRVMYTENDLLRLAFNEEMAFRRCGITKNDTVLLACTMDRCFIAGLAYFLGIRNIGAATLRDGVNNFSRHMEMLNRFKPTVIVGVPSFLRKLGLYMINHGAKKTSAKKLVCIGEPIKNKQLDWLPMGHDLEEIWEAKVFSTYASTEMVTTFCECEEQNGGHFHPALGIVEIVDNQGKVLPIGETGEVTITPLFVEGMPLLRYKTGDISFLSDNSCACKRHSMRLGPIIGRKQQMIKYKGTTLYPQAIYTVLDNITEINEYYVEVTSDYNLSDQIKVFVSLKNNTCPVDHIVDTLQAGLRVKPQVVMVANEIIKKRIHPQCSRKVNRFFDKREKA